MTLLLSVATPKNTIKVHGTLVADLKHHDRRLTRQTSIFELSIKRRHSSIPPFMVSREIMIGRLIVLFKTWSGRARG